MVSMLSSSCQRITAKATWIAVVIGVILLGPGYCYTADKQQATWPPGRENQVHGDPVRIAIERMSEHEVKAFYVRCSQEVAEGKLGSGETMICSIGYDVLLRKHFAGNFDSLLAWSRAQLNPAAPSEAVARPPADRARKQLNAPR